MSDREHVLLSGWGRTAATAAVVVRPQQADDVAVAVKVGADRGAIARGLGRSYGDAAQCAGGAVVDCTALTGVRSLDRERGTVTVAAGTTIDSLLREVLPHGWFVPVTPGTRHVTVGGAIAADVHGKNHHGDGSICRHVTSLTMWTPADGVVTVGPEDPAGAALFWATAGGMGLTGVVLEVTLRLLAVESPLMRVATERAPDLDAAMALMTHEDAAFRYSVAWIDLLARGRTMGRSVLTRGDHADAEDEAAWRGREPRTYAPRPLATVPPVVPPRLLNRLTIGAFNELWFRRAPRRRRDTIQSIGAFFHPLDAVRGWNRLYGRPGFLQYQFVVPFGEEAAVRTAVELLSASRCPSFLAILKRFGAGTPGPLSFPVAGWTLAVDIPAAVDGLPRLLDRLDEVVLGAGGRLYLAKDARMRPELLEPMYPRLAVWREVRERADPDRVLQSDLGRRLGL